jgi:uncharacterized membrane protein
MFFMRRRYSRSGYAPPLFYVALALGFSALLVWALVRGDWLVALLAAAMIAVTAVGGRFMRRFASASRESQRQVNRNEDSHE